MSAGTLGWTDPADAVSDVASAVGLVEGATRPEDLFGPVRADDLPGARRTYRRLARYLHPDATRDKTGQGAGTFVRLRDMYEAFAQACGSYAANPTGPPPAAAMPGSRPGPVVVRSRRSELRVAGRFAVGDIANVYDVELTPLSAGSAVPPGRPAAPVRGAWKLARHPRDNDLLAAEATALTRLCRDGDPRFAVYAPRLLDAFTHREVGTGIERGTTVTARLDGFVSLAEVAAGYPSGIDPRDAAWIWRRLLVALGYAHRAGVLHGAVLPEHVLIEPVGHGLVLVDWCYSRVRPDPVPSPRGRGAGGTAAKPGWPPLAAMVSARADLYPPEVAAKKPAGPGTDVYLATRTMTVLIGKRLPAPMRLFAAGCTGTSLATRPHDAWALQREFDELLERMYGRRRFRPFGWPPPKTDKPETKES